MNIMKTIRLSHQAAAPDSDPPKYTPESSHEEQTKPSQPPLLILLTRTSALLLLLFSLILTLLILGVPNAYTQMSVLTIQPLDNEVGPVYNISGTGNGDPTFDPIDGPGGIDGPTFDSMEGPENNVTGMLNDDSTLDSSDGDDRRRLVDEGLSDGVGGPSVWVGAVRKSQQLFNMYLANDPQTYARSSLRSPRWSVLRPPKLPIVSAFLHSMHLLIEKQTLRSSPSLWANRCSPYQRRPKRRYRYS